MTLNTDPYESPTVANQQKTSLHKEESTEVAPHPGSRAMPRWNVAELPVAPRFGLRQLPLLLGPGLLMGAAAIGGGEWLTGPMATARYGGAILWLATLSILGQVIYNIEISRYTLYTGEPIFTGKFRTLPGPAFWLPLYLILDFGSFLPYLASNGATPLYAMVFRHLPDPKNVPADAVSLKIFAVAIFTLALVPLLFGGKIYNSLKSVMTFKLVVVVGFLLFLAFFYTSPATWQEIIGGFFRLGTVPVVDETNKSAVKNIFVSLFNGEGFPVMDLSMIGILATLAAISGNGGLTNTPISNYTRDQGWGMGAHVGAIPSIFGRHSISLSHVGKVFLLSAESLRRWSGWYWHIAREQLLVWMPACFIGVALPCLLSIRFLPRGFVLTGDDQWIVAGTTADGVANSIGGPFANVFWFLTLFCGFLVLFTAMVATADGVLRRWIDVLWTASKRLQAMDPEAIGGLYFRVLCGYAVVGVLMLCFVPGNQLLVLSGVIYNYALGFSCFHSLYVNSVLLPKEIRPKWFSRTGLVLAGTFFLFIAVLATYANMTKIHAAIEAILNLMR